MGKDDFYTFRGYTIKDEKLLSPSMEDYIEMIYRLSLQKDDIRVYDLSQALNVQPPSTTKMIKKLSVMKLADYQKYGCIILTEEGMKIGEYLLDRHNTINKFLSFIGVNESVFEQTEKIEHLINQETLSRICDFMSFMEFNNNFEEKYRQYLDDK